MTARSTGLTSDLPSTETACQHTSYDSAPMVHVLTDQPLQILHLEDSLTDHQLVKQVLRKAKLHCTLTQTDTLDALSVHLKKGTFQLVLADYRLPGFTAVDAWTRARDTASPPPFVLLSGAIGEKAAVDIMRLGFADYLLKEDLVRLPHVIERALEMQEAKRAREQAVNELRHSEQRLAELTEHLQRSIEAERTSIAREIHDDIGGALTAVRFDLAWIQRNSQDSAIQAHAQAAVEMLQHAIGASQRIMMDLRPPVLDQGLVAALQWLVEGFERRTGVTTCFHAKQERLHLPDDVQLVAYRTAQEALTNIVKYAAAQQVHIDLSDSGQVLTLEITDDGQGIAAGMRDKPKAFGLRGLAERAKTVQGWLDVSSKPGQGTSVILSIPLHPAPL